MEEVLQEEEECRVAAAAAAASAAGSSEATNLAAAEGEKEKEEEDGKNVSPIKLSSIINKNKIDNETMQKCRENGIIFDLEIETKHESTPSFSREAEKIDVEEEKKRSINCPYWTDKSEFKSQFQLEELDEESEIKMKDLFMVV